MRELGPGFARPGGVVANAPARVHNISAMRVLAALVLSVAAGFCAAERAFELHLRIEPPAPASVAVYGSTTPFSTAGLADAAGRARFKGLLAGSYTVSAIVRGYGEIRQTVVVGPSVADSKGRVRVTLRVRESGTLGESARQRARVSARQLAVADRAWKEYNDAQKDLARRDIEGAVAHLERAVEIAPQFSTAWNNLGTIAYQTRQYEKAAGHFRESLRQDPDAYEPLVNLGGTLLSLGQPDQALPFNLQSALRRPEDALANSQLGMNYHFLGKPDLGIKYLNIAKKLDPAHFSNPQLVLADIYLRRNDGPAAADELEEFLKLHPDWPAAASVRGAIEKLRQQR